MQCHPLYLLYCHLSPYDIRMAPKEVVNPCIANSRGCTWRVTVSSS